MKIECHGISFRYPGSRESVFQDLDISLLPRITILRGYSGCGKSTLLRLAAGMLKPTSGRIETDGLERLGSRNFFRRDLSMVFQDLNLLPLASVGRNLQLASQFAGTSSDLADRWLHELGLGEMSKRPVERLSGGQRQRVAIARALTKQPKALFLDEPTSGLDDNNTDIIRTAVRDFASGGNTICVIATHDHRLLDLADELVDFHSFISLPE